MTIYLDFEKDLAEVHSKISDLEGIQDSSSSKNIKNPNIFFISFTYLLDSGNCIKSMFLDLNPASQ